MDEDFKVALYGLLLAFVATFILVIVYSTYLFINSLISCWYIERMLYYLFIAELLM